MLYDNALLAVCYLEAWQATGAERYGRVVRETLDYILRDMTGPEGGFYSTEDADSEGEEGKFYVWSPDEVQRFVGKDAARDFCYVYDISPEGNFEGHSILNLPKTIEQCARILGRDPSELESALTESRRKLFDAREKRVRPGRDDKVLTSWNGLMIEAMARAGAAMGANRYVEAAVSAARFVLDTLGTKDGRLLHCWRNGEARYNGYLEDYASLAGSLVTLYESTFDERWIDEAIRLADVILDQFHDPQQGSFFFASRDHESLIARKKDMTDSSTPSGGGLAVMTLLRLGKLCGRGDYLVAAESALQGSLGLIGQAPMGAAQLLLALDTYLGPTPEIVVLGDRCDEALNDLRRLFIPNRVIALRDFDGSTANESPALADLFEGKEPIPPGPTLFVCQDFACASPVSGRDPARRALAALARHANDENAH
jgi:uncharacterized protein YyaL (SSP411 family)